MISFHELLRRIYIISVWVEGSVSIYLVHLFMLSLKSIVSLFSFVVVTIDENEVVKLPPTTVLGLIYKFHLIALLLWARFICDRHIYLESYYPVCVEWLSLSLLPHFVVKSLLSHNIIALPACVLVTFTWSTISQSYPLPKMVSRILEYLLRSRK